MELEKINAAFAVTEMACCWFQLTDGNGFHGFSSSFLRPE